MMNSVKTDALLGVWMCLTFVACAPAPLLPLVNGTAPAAPTGLDVIAGSGSVLGNGASTAAGGGGSAAPAATDGMGGVVAGGSAAGAAAGSGTAGVAGAAIAGSSGAAPSAGSVAAAGSGGAPSAGSGGAKCPTECLRAYTCASACGATEFNNGCCPCPAGTIDTVSCPKSSCVQGAAGCVSTNPGWCGLPCTGAAPSRDVETACANLKTTDTCAAFSSASFPYRCAWHTPADPPCLAP
jgi:hypothetical protein